MMHHIERAVDLPRVGTSEQPWLDFKAIPTDDPFEIAKDIAALANSLGGTLLIGAAAKGEHLVKYLPLTQQKASQAQRTYDAAVKTRCSPIPQFSISHIEAGDGLVLAINVLPFPGQIVGVEVKKGEAKCGSSAAEVEGLYYFPLRVGTHTISILPEQLAMFIDPKARRLAICLAQAIGSIVVLSCPTVQLRGADSGAGLWLEPVTLTRVDLLQNAITVALSREGESHEVAIPFDLIEAAWNTGECWRVVARGKSKECTGRRAHHPPSRASTTTSTLTRNESQLRSFPPRGTLPNKRLRRSSLRSPSNR